MTATLTPPSTSSPPVPPRRRRLLPALVAAAVLAAGGLGAGLTLSLGGSSASPPGSASAGTSSAYDYYRSVMGRFASGGMMGGGYGWTTGPSGYGWMMGGSTAPGWMTGGSLPGFMMGSGTDPGSVMGELFADAPGPRVTPADAARLGDQVPAGATVDRAANRITFATQDVELTVLASPAMPAEEFRAAGLTDPAIVVPAGARVGIQLINADEDMAHGLVITAAGAASSWMPMMNAPPAFPGAAVWFLGESTSAGMHAGTITFTASTPGSYQYLCPVPGHAQEGMTGSFVVH